MVLKPTPVFSSNRALIGLHHQSIKYTTSPLRTGYVVATNSYFVNPNNFCLLLPSFLLFWSSYITSLCIPCVPMYCVGKGLGRSHQTSSLLGTRRGCGSSKRSCGRSAQATAHGSNQKVNKYSAITQLILY